MLPLGSWHCIEICVLSPKWLKKDFCATQIEKHERKVPKPLTHCQEEEKINEGIFTWTFSGAHRFLLPCGKGLETEHMGVLSAFKGVRRTFLGEEGLGINLLRIYFVPSTVFGTWPISSHPLLTTVPWGKYWWQQPSLIRCRCGDRVQWLGGWDELTQGQALLSSSARRRAKHFTLIIWINPHSSPWGRYYCYYSHFTDEETEVEEQESFSRSCSWLVVELGSEPRQSVSRPPALHH